MTVHDEYDAYLVHASENAELAKAIADTLTLSGFRIWFNAFEPGYSLRRQMNAALASASCAIVLVTADLFKKQWALEELDAVFNLEGAEQGRIVPVWVGLSASDVRRSSPMLASRSAILFEDIENTAAAIRRALTSRLRVRSVGQLLRSEIAGGFKWESGPVWLSESFSYYDAHFSDFADVGLWRYPDVPNVSSGWPHPHLLGDILAAPFAFNGVPITVAGHQREAGRQTLSTVVPFEWNIESPSELGRPTNLASFLFQLSSRMMPDCQFAYVQCLGPWSPPTPKKRWGPWGEETDICWVSGLVMAYGSVPMLSGGNGQCVYIAASRIWFMPPAGDQQATG